jgi:hypothetical protein
LFGQHHRQRDAAEPRAGMVQEASSIEQMTADEVVELSHSTAIPEPNPVDGATGLLYTRRSADGTVTHLTRIIDNADRCGQVKRLLMFG